MTKKKPRPVFDFDNPPWPYVLEDRLKRFFGLLLIYGPYVRSLRLPAGAKVLDLGCGGASETLALLRAVGPAGQVTCVDTSKYWIDRARRRLARYPNAECLHGDIRLLDIGEESFDAAVAIRVIHDIAPDVRAETAAAIASKLRPRGLFFVWEPTRPGHGMTVEEIRKLFSDAGLREASSAVGKRSYKGKFEKPGKTREDEP
ncbi:MAG: class I SAM-dependent methyltransferase [Candidatus Aminicenantes bacterium]